MKKQHGKSISQGYDAPCHNCTDRKVLCHSTCEVYKDFTNEVKSLSQNRRDDIDRHYTTGIKYSKGDKIQKRPQK